MLLPSDCCHRLSFYNKIWLYFTSKYHGSLQNVRPLLLTVNILNHPSRQPFLYKRQFIVKKSEVTRQIWFILKLFDHFILQNVTTRKLTVCNLGNFLWRIPFPKYQLIHSLRTKPTILLEWENLWALAVAKVTFF